MNLKINDKVGYKTSKNSLQTYHGKILGFKVDKIEVTKYKYSDYSGECPNTWIDKEDIL